MKMKADTEKKLSEAQETFHLVWDAARRHGFRRDRRQEALELKRELVAALVQFDAIAAEAFIETPDSFVLEMAGRYLTLAAKMADLIKFPETFLANRVQ
jgi:hypothetical protein